MGAPQNGWFIMENFIKMDDLGVQENLHIVLPFIDGTKYESETYYIINRINHLLRGMSFQVLIILMQIRVHFGNLRICFFCMKIFRQVQFDDFRVEHVYPVVFFSISG